MVREDRTTWKANYFLRLVELFDEYPKCFLVGVDNVGSKQMQEIRQAMRGEPRMIVAILRSCFTFLKTTESMHL